MAESFQNLDHILHDWERDKKKKYCRGVEQVREAHFSRKKKDKSVFFLRKWHRKNSPAVRRRARLNQTQNWLVSREPLLNKPTKQNVYAIDSFNKFNFSQSQEILDTLIDVRNAKHQNITS